MEPIKSFKELSARLTAVGRTRVALANAVDEHSLEAITMAIKAGFVEAYLVGSAEVIKQFDFLQTPDVAPYVHITDIVDTLEATVEAVRKVKEGEADVLMKGLVNTDVLIRAILDKEKGNGKKRKALYGEHPAFLRISGRLRKDKSAVSEIPGRKETGL